MAEVGTVTENVSKGFTVFVPMRARDFADLDCEAASPAGSSVPGCWIALHSR